MENAAHGDVAAYEFTPGRPRDTHLCLDCARLNKCSVVVHRPGSGNHHPAISSLARSTIRHSATRLQLTPLVKVAVCVQCLVQQERLGVVEVAIISEEAWVEYPQHSPSIHLPALQSGARLAVAAIAVRDIRHDKAARLMVERKDVTIAW